jgi:hypothetical protein
MCNETPDQGVVREEMNADARTGRVLQEFPAEVAGVGDGGIAVFGVRQRGVRDDVTVGDVLYAYGEGAHRRTHSRGPTAFSLPLAAYREEESAASYF